MRRRRRTVDRFGGGADRRRAKLEFDELFALIGRGSSANRNVGVRRQRDAVVEEIGLACKRTDRTVGEIIVEPFTRVGRAAAQAGKHKRESATPMQRRRRRLRGGRMRPQPSMGAS